VIDPGEAVFDAVLSTAHLEHVGDEPSSRANSVARWQAGLDAIVGQDSVDFARCCLDESCEVGRCGETVGLVHQLDEGELAGPINGNKKIALSLLGLHFGNVDVEVADRLGLECLLGGLVTADLRQTAAAVTLQATIQ
jgi:hypothetical protein